MDGRKDQMPNTMSPHFSSKKAGDNKQKRRPNIDFKMNLDASQSYLGGMKNYFVYQNPADQNFS